MEPASSSPDSPPRQGKETNWPMNVQGATEMGGVREDEFASKIVGNDPTNVSSLFDHAATRVTTGLAVHSEEMIDRIDFREYRHHDSNKSRTKKIFAQKH